MNLNKIALAITFAVVSTIGFGQNPSQIALSTVKDSIQDYKFSINTTWLSFTNFEEEKKNLQHYELHLKYKLTPKDRIGIKIATWKLFAPLGIPLWDSLFLKESEFYPGRLREDGLGFTYQRLLWKGLFATVEILPQLKTYYDINKSKIGNGFKLYTSYHLGYHIPMFKNRIFIEPQIHCQYWPIDTNTPQAFKQIDNKWNNYFLFEPNIYIGVKF
jgi:hypothetical protein